jgi:hypothetical protein
MRGAPDCHEGDTGRLEAVNTSVLKRNLKHYDPVDALLFDEAGEDLALLKRGRHEHVIVSSLCLLHHARDELDSEGRK